MIEELAAEIKDNSLSILKFLSKLKTSIAYKQIGLSLDEFKNDNEITAAIAPLLKHELVDIDKEDIKINDKGEKALIDIDNFKGENDLINKVLIFAYNNNCEDYQPDNYSNKLGIGNIPRTLRILEKLTKIGLIQKNQKMMGGSPSYYTYQLSSDGHTFINTTPVEYFNKPYYYYLDLEDKKRVKEEEKEGLQIQQIQSSVAASANTINSNYWIKRATIIMAIATFIYTIIATMTYIKDRKNNQQQQQRLDTLEQRIHKLEK